MRDRPQERGRKDHNKHKGKDPDKDKAKDKRAQKKGIDKEKQPSTRRPCSTDSRSYSYSSYYSEDEEELYSSRHKKAAAAKQSMPIGARIKTSQSQTSREDKKKPSPIGARRRAPPAGQEDDSRERQGPVQSKKVRLVAKAKVVPANRTAAAPPRKGSTPTVEGNSKGAGRDKNSKGVKSRLRTIVQTRAAREGKSLEQMQTELLQEARRRKVTLQYLLEGKNTTSKDCVPFRFANNESTQSAVAAEGGGHGVEEHKDEKGKKGGGGSTECKQEQTSCKEEKESPSGGEQSPLPMADFDRTTTSPTKDSEGEQSPSLCREQQADMPRKGRAEGPDSSIRVSDINLGLFRDSHVVTGIPRTKLHTYGLYVPEAARSDPELRMLYSVGGAVLGPGCRPAHGALAWGRDVDGDYVIQSCLGWQCPPLWSSSSYSLSSFAGVAYSTLPGHQLAALGRRLCEALRHREAGLDAAGFADFDYIVCTTKIPAWQVMAVALFNWDSHQKMHRFDLHVEGTPNRGTLWPLASPDIPKERGTSIHIRATRKHTVQLGY
jgi:hypothetical protein